MGPLPKRSGKREKCVQKKKIEERERDKWTEINGKRYNLDVIEQEYNSVNSNKINAVSNDEFLFLFSIMPIAKSTLKILGVTHVNLKSLKCEK